MEIIPKVDAPTPEELEQEQLALQEAKEEEVRASIISEFGFDEELDADKIDKAVSKEMKHRKDWASITKQKVKHRTEAEELRKAIPPTKTDVKIDADEVGKVVDSKLKETLEQRDLDALEYSDELKAEIKRIAQIAGSVKQALKDPYIIFKIEAYEKEQKVAEATIGRTHKSGKTKEFDINNPPEFDPNDIEGSEKRMKEWEQEAKKRGS